MSVDLFLLRFVQKALVVRGLKTQGLALFQSHMSTLLVLSGVIFFPMTGMGQYCGFVLNIGWWYRDGFVIAEQHLDSTKALFCFLNHPSAGGTQGVWKRQPGQVILADQRDVPDHAASCSVCKGGGRRKGDMFGVTVFVSPSHCYMW